MEKCFNKLTELLVRLHLHKTEENLRSLQPLVWRSLRQQLTVPTP